MDNNFFNEQVKKMVVEYQDKGFTMNKERAIQWFKYFSELSESKFENAVEEVLKTVSHCPTMADIFKTKSMSSAQSPVYSIEEIERLKRES